MSNDWPEEYDDDGEAVTLDSILAIEHEPFYDFLKRATLGAWAAGHSYFPCPFCHHGTVHLYRRWRDAIPRFLKSFGLHRILAARGKCTGCGMEMSPTVSLPWPFIESGAYKKVTPWLKVLYGLALIGVGMWSSGSWRHALLSVGAVLLFVVALSVRDSAMYHTKPRKLNGWKWFLIEYLFFLITIVAFSMIWPK